MGQSPGVKAVVNGLLQEWSGPLVVDADGLNAIVGDLERFSKRPSPTVISPHPGEFSRLCGLSIADIQAHREEVAVEFARRHRVVVILKGHQSVITDGARVGINETGNPGMATGGSGDVLTGLLAALLAQEMEAFDAARLAAHLHGLAGDIGADRYSPVSLIASDLLQAIPEAWMRLESQWRTATHERRGRLNPPR
ncbi:MAG: NAD(P)H-hydrate dehydratase [Planctomycetota bacterium]